MDIFGHWQGRAPCHSIKTTTGSGPTGSCTSRKSSDLNSEFWVTSGVATKYPHNYNQQTQPAMLGISTSKKRWNITQTSSNITMRHPKTSQIHQFNHHNPWVFPACYVAICPALALAMISLPFSCKRPTHEIKTWHRTRWNCLLEPL